MKAQGKPLLILLFLVLVQTILFAGTDNVDNRPKIDLANQKTLYVVGYSHLDTQWRWDYQTTVDEYIKKTLDQNFIAFEKYPEYNFNFTGSRRYEMMEEYYPDKFEKVKGYIKDGRWFVSGSSVDECDVNIPSPESIIRQVLYGNQYFRREFGVESYDFILPDCFGFQSSMPSIWAHCGLKGFSTQKLTWGSANGIPYNVGVWEGPDGNSVITAFNPGAYTGSIKGRVDTNKQWANRINENGMNYGLFADYHYYGVGDTGGAPRSEDIENYTNSLSNPDALFTPVFVPSDQMYLDINADQRASLPTYKGDLLLTEHSAGSITSQSYMKRWNRKNEMLADAAERSATIAAFFGANDYPTEKIYNSWHRVLSSQMHDIMPGTCIPKAYDYSENDEVIALNGFASVLEDSTASLSRVLDTNVKGQPVVVYNPLAVAREDIVEAELATSPKAVKVFDANNNEVPSQIISRKNGKTTIVFTANVPAVSYSVYDVQSTNKNCEIESNLSINSNSIENEYYKIVVAANGNVASIFDKKNKKELLASEHKLAFLYECPASWPAWNMDWNDRKNAPEGYVDGPAVISIVENGPARVALQIKRQARDSFFTQTVSLSAGESGRRVEFKNFIDWQSQKCSLKASFPLTVSNEMATYNQGLGKIQRSTNDPKKYEVPSHQWFDLTDASGDYGVTIMEDCKFGSDKPSASELRLTLLFTPYARGGYKEQNYQDWGRHEMTYAVLGHQESWQSAGSDWHAKRLNQPLRAFNSSKHTGKLGREFSMLNIDTEQIEITAVKKAEDSDYTIIRFQELWGQRTPSSNLSSLTGIADAYEVDGQERRIAPAFVVDGKLKFSMGKFGIRSFAVKFNEAPVKLTRAISKPLALAYNVDVMSNDTEPSKDSMDASGVNIPAELMPKTLTCESVDFKLGSGDSNNAIACKGQTIKLPRGNFNRLYILAAASEDTATSFKLGNVSYPLTIQAYNGFVGQYDKRLWSNKFGRVDFRGNEFCTGLDTAYIKRDNIAFFTKHRHDSNGKNEAYHFTYLFKYELPLNANMSSVTLPDDSGIKVFAMTVADNPNIVTTPAASLYDTFDNFGPVDLRVIHVEPVYVTETMVPCAKVSTQCVKDDYDELSEGAPKSDDYVSDNDIVIQYVRSGKFARPHHNSGSRGIDLPRLSDGKKANNSDDTSNNVWFDGSEARLFIDLKKSIAIDKMNTYSWHKSNRAPQVFLLWGSNAETPPAKDFNNSENGWQYLATVDTKVLGDGGIHCSSVDFAGKDLKYRYLLLLLPDRGEGTFLTEIDIIEAE
ncbi:MAG: alpha-mannosidase [Phycisphaerae bacterium]|nr:alpha-mannosidase [Phycisphaerae bacterium]